MKNEHGVNSEELVNNDKDVVLVRWKDIRSVILASIFTGIGEEDKVKRWDAKNKKYIDVDRPEIVKKYNNGMGGVDLMDRFISFYRIYIKSRKWTLRMIFHAVDLAIVNSWIEYRTYAIELKVPQKEILDLLHFKMRVAECLVKVDAPLGPKVGRPDSQASNRSHSETSNIDLAFTEPSTSTPRKRKFEFRPVDEVRKDTIDHTDILFSVKSTS